MAGMMVSAATGMMGSVIGKLTALLGEKYQLARDVEKGIRFLRDELSTMEAVLERLADKDDDQIDPVARDWRSKVRELSYDIEDCIDRFVLNHSHGGGSKANFVRKAMRKVKTLLKDGGIAKEIQELKSLLTEQSERGKRYYDISQCLLPASQPVLLDPRAPALFQEAKDLVGVDGPRKEIIQLLKCKDKEHRVVSIYGIGGQGKTTLAMEVYRKVTETFDCQAFLSVSQTPDINKILRDILSQTSKGKFDGQSERWEAKQLISTTREYLMDKRYFILIDDIWSVSVWEHVRSALPPNDIGSRIITTTRSKEVAYSCCNGKVAQMYEAKPLSDGDSQKLFFKRLFWSSEDCPHDLMKVSADIMRKCGGLPLAIISIAGLLAPKSRSVDVWASLSRYIAAAVDKDSPIDRMKRILLLSYYDLPRNLKSCLLYLSVFPEDYSINCQRLILLWVAEGLIPGQDRESMEQQGRSYLNELINRSLVQPTEVRVDGATVRNCRVHDIILEFIVSKAVDDNFVTIWNGNKFSDNYSSKKIRRLSIQKDISGQAEEIGKALRNTAHIRSINIFGSNSVLVQKHTSEFLSSQVLRVLNTDGLDEECDLGHVKSFGQLKYLRIANTPHYRCVCMVPDNIEKLQHLETLDVPGFTVVRRPPASIIQLQKLVRLFVDADVKLPDGIENLRALEELAIIGLENQSVKFIHGLGALTNLRVLKINFWDSWREPVRDMEGHKKACISSLSKLFMSLRELRVWHGGFDVSRSFMVHSFEVNSMDSTAPPLWSLHFCTRNLNSVGPQIIWLVNLTRLSIVIHGEASMGGINILAGLPKLLSLTVYIKNDYSSGIVYPRYPRYTINRQGFQHLVKFNLHSCWRAAAVEFETGAMPKLQRLKLLLMACGQFEYGEGGLVLGLQNLALAGLKDVDVQINCTGAVGDEVEALEDDIRSAAGAHPNTPKLQVKRIFEDRMASGVQQAPIPSSQI